MVFIIIIINKEIADAAILGNKQCSMRDGLVCLIAGAVSVTWFALGVQAPNYIFVIREQYQTKPDICTSLISKKIFYLFLPCYTMG